MGNEICTVLRSTLTHHLILTIMNLQVQREKYEALILLESVNT